AGCAGAGDGATGCGAGGGVAGAACGAGADVAAPPAVLVLAITVPTGTTSFSLNNISAMVPSAVEGTSLSTLSVAISRMVSSIFTLSPGCLCHFKTVASMMLSPILGITKSTIAINIF